MQWFSGGSKIFLWSWGIHRDLCMQTDRELVFVPCHWMLARETIQGGEMGRGGAENKYIINKQKQKKRAIFLIPKVCDFYIGNPTYLYRGIPRVQTGLLHLATGLSHRNLRRVILLCPRRISLLLPQEKTGTNSSVVNLQLACVWHGECQGPAHGWDISESWWGFCSGIYQIMNVMG